MSDKLIWAMGRVLDPKAELKHQLESNFYHLTAVNLANWRVYAEMRSFLDQVYDIPLADDDLPPHDHEEVMLHHGVWHVIYSSFSTGTGHTRDCQQFE